MAISYSSDLQDEIALRVSGRSYNDLTDDQKKIIDGDSSNPVPTAGAAGRAYEELSKWAVYRTMDSTVGIPDEWKSWFVMQAAGDAGGRFTSADINEIRQERSRARRDALSAYIRSNPEDTTDSAHLGLTTVEMRRYCLASALRQSRPLLPEPFLIDQAIQEAIARTWDHTDWNFRRQTVTLTIATDGSVTVSGSLILDRLTSDAIFYTSAGDRGAKAVHVDIEEMLQMTAYDNSDGRPDYFHVRPSDAGLQWTFERTPNEEYTAKAEGVTKVGALTTPAEMDTALGEFPVDFHQYLKKRALANLYEIAGRVQIARELESECDRDLQVLARQDLPDRNMPVDRGRQRRQGMGRMPRGGIEGGFT